MKSVVEQLAFYDFHHRNPWNKATHVVGIPSIIYALFVPLSWIRLPVFHAPITAGMAFGAGVLLYYLRLDRTLAAAMALLVGPLVYAAHRTAALPWAEGLIYSGVFFVGGWILQFIGHGVFEKRRPAFMDNLVQLLIGPLYFGAEGLFVLGLKRDLRAELARQREKMDGGGEGVARQSAGML